MSILKKHIYKCNWIFHTLLSMISKDGKDKQSTVTVPLDTALQRAKQEGRQDLYTTLFMEAIDIVTDFSKDFSNYLPVDRTEIALIEVWARLTDDIIRHEVDRMIALKNRCLTVISDSKDVLNITTTNALQESYREKVSRQITLVKIIYKNLGQNTLPFRAGMNAPVPKARIMLECPAWE